MSREVEKKRITVVKLGLDKRGSNKSGSVGVKVRTNAAKITYVEETGLDE